MTEKFLNVVKKIDIQAQEVQRVPNEVKPNRPTPRHIIFKMPKFKDKKRILKAIREKQLVTYKRAPRRLSGDFSTETLQARRAWHKIFKVMKYKDLWPRLLYSVKLSFRIEGQVKSFPDKKKLIYQHQTNITRNVRGRRRRMRRKDRKYRKEPVRNKKHNTWNEEYTRRNQQQNKWSRGSNQPFRR